MSRTVAVALDRAGVDHIVILTRQHDIGAILATTEDQADAAFRALTTAPELATWWRRDIVAGSPGTRAPLAERAPTGAQPKAVELFQYLAAPSGELAGSPSGHSSRHNRTVSRAIWHR